MAFVAIVVGYLMLRLQDVLPLNPNGAAAQSPDLAFNTSVSFETNTNWQNYGGETGASYLTQMTMLAVRNFTSAATGLAVAIALVRGLTRRTSTTIGNYWVDLTRGDPLHPAADRGRRSPSCSSGRASRRRSTGRRTVTTLEGAQQTIARGTGRDPGDHQGAGQQRRRVLQRQLGASVREPDAPDELPRDGRDVRDPVRPDLHVRAVREGSAPGLGASSARWRRSSWSGRSSRCARRRRRTRCSRRGVDQALGNMEGKEMKFGAGVGALWAAVTTSTSTGAINAWHDSFQPIGGLVPLFNMQLGEVTPGGIGAGLYGMLVIGAILAVFIAGPDGRPDARVPRQEGRGVRDEDGDARRPRPRRQHPRASRPSRPSRRRVWPAR